MPRETIHNGWELDIYFPLPERIREKPRRNGITMVIDKGTGLRETFDILEMCAEYIDFWKLSFGSSALYHPAILRKKIELLHSFNIIVFPGGTFLEIALIQGKGNDYLHRARELGFSAVEISDGTIELPPRKRSRLIEAARENNLLVLTEIGKKEADEAFYPELMGEQVKRDLDDGAFKVILEARESGKDVTIFNHQGNIEMGKMNKLLLSIPEQEQIIWEAPLKKQQVDFITMFGPNVNLGNIPPEEILALEALRSGLRADTFKLSLGDEKRGSKISSL